MDKIKEYKPCSFVLNLTFQNPHLKGDAMNLTVTFQNVNSFLF